MEACGRGRHLRTPAPGTALSRRGLRRVPRASGPGPRGRLSGPTSSIATATLCPLLAGPEAEVTLIARTWSLCRPAGAATTYARLLLHVPALCQLTLIVWTPTRDRNSVIPRPVIRPRAAPVGATNTNEGLTTTPTKRQLWLPSLWRTRRLRGYVRVYLTEQTASPCSTELHQAGRGHESVARMRSKVLASSFQQSFRPAQFMQ